MANSINERIFKQGTIVGATKLPVITIGIGRVVDLKSMPEVIWRNEAGEVVIATKEAPQGCIYDQERTVVVRVIGDQVKMNGMYDIYAPAPNKIEKLLSNSFNLNTMSDEHRKELLPILEAGSEVRPSIAPAEYGRKVIIITDEMVAEQGYIECHCPWDPEDVFTKLYAGDIFLVEDEENHVGYRIGKEEFEGTHQLEG